MRDRMRWKGGFSGIAIPPRARSVPAMLRGALVAIPVVVGCGGQTRSAAVDRPAPQAPPTTTVGAPSEEPPLPIVVDVAALEQRLAGEKLAGTVLVMYGDHL